MARLRSRKSAVPKPKIPAWLAPLRRRFANISTKHLYGTKSEYAGYGLLPEEFPFVKNASTSIFSLGDMQFYVPLSVFPVATKMVMFCMQTLTNIQKDEGLDWNLLVLAADSVCYDKGVVPCSVDFRRSPSDVVIRITLNADCLVISLPPPGEWRQSGLGWLSPKTRDTRSCCH